VHAEAFAVMVAVKADFAFNPWDLEILPYYRIRYHGVSVFMRRAFDNHYMNLKNYNNESHIVKLDSDYLLNLTLGKKLISKPNACPFFEPLFI
jgi:hypothetical protein